jgi:hypothetical protein
MEEHAKLSSATALAKGESATFKTPVEGGARRATALSQRTLGFRLGRKGAQRAGRLEGCGDFTDG